MTWQPMVHTAFHICACQVRAKLEEKTSGSPKTVLISVDMDMLFEAPYAGGLHSAAH